MFEFEKLQVYHKAKAFNKYISKLLATNSHIDNVTRYQLRKAALSIMLNIAEGSSRFSKAGRRNFYIISRGSAFECLAVLDYLQDEQIINDEQMQFSYLQLEELSRMLFGLIKNSES